VEAIVAQRDSAVGSLSPQSRTLGVGVEAAAGSEAKTKERGQRRSPAPTLLTRPELRFGF
jgi:hypothetical protein